MRHVLVVDDDDEIRTLLDRMLSHRGYSVTTARDGYQALTEVIRRRPHLIVSDILMPPPDGIRLLEMLKSQAIVIPSILITAYPVHRPHPANALLFKPLDVPLLLATIADLIDPASTES
jgi:CheY-like chemotaxis protein